MTIHFTCVNQQQAANLRDDICEQLVGRPEFIDNRIVVADDEDEPGVYLSIDGVGDDIQIDLDY